MLSSDIYTPVSKLYRTHNFLNFVNIYELKFAKLIYQLQHQKFSEIFTKSFTKLDAVHSLNMKQIQSRNYLLPRVKNLKP